MCGVKSQSDRYQLTTATTNKLVDSSSKHLVSAIQN